MAIYRRGADPVALRASAERIGACSRELDAIRGHAGQAVRGLRSEWGGGGLDAFIRSWPDTEASLAGCLTTFDAMALALRRNAGAQDHTSNAAGSGSSLARKPRHQPRIR